MSYSSEGNDYFLFTRIKRGDDLVQVGSFRAGSDELAKVYAQRIYDEEDWVEMHLVKNSDLIPVRVPEGLFEKEGVK
ncbi:hypothetical protein SAMN05421743_103206 [Thalassobacillus cyri]|uniref:Phenylacetic acid degradation B n=1 Tax=Thalassobacillus cyri TaxID=571932 RepID=A0A1H3ZD10_9BACI|nr:hypothetical protein [Thalassobacillus cyri]SEA21663.1 hypothetical protein SAMN05421743_103206 [Thalassobacillus cyri]